MMVLVRGGGRRHGRSPGKWGGLDEDHGAPFLAAPPTQGVELLSWSLLESGVREETRGATPTWPHVNSDQPQASRAAAPAPGCFTPARTVPQTVMSLMAIGSTSSGLSASTVKSAHLPVSMLPRSSSSPSR